MTDSSSSEVELDLYEEIVKINYSTPRVHFPMTTSSSAIAEGPRDALSELKSCQLLHNCTKNHIEGVPFHVV